MSNTKFINIGYVTESKKSKEGKSEKTYMLTINPSDKSLSGIQLARGTKILLREPKRGKNQSQEDYDKLREWKLMECTLIQEDSIQADEDI